MKELKELLEALTEANERLTKLPANDYSMALLSLLNINIKLTNILQDHILEAVVIV